MTLETVAEAMGSSKNRSIPGWGQTGQDGGHKTQMGPQPPPHPTHRNSFRRRFKSGSGRAVQGLCQRFEGRRAGKKGSAQVYIAGCHQERGGGCRCWTPGDFTARRLQWVQPADTTPTRHCGPRTGAERAHSGRLCTVCPNRSAPGSGMADRIFPGESRAQDEARQGEAGGAE